MKKSIFIILLIVVISGCCRVRSIPASWNYQMALVVGKYKGQLPKKHSITGKPIYQETKYAYLTIMKNYTCICKQEGYGNLYGEWEMKGDSVVICKYNMYKGSHDFKKKKMDTIQINTYRLVDKGCLSPIQGNIRFCQE